MRTLHVVITIASGAPILSATIASCGGDTTSCPQLDASSKDATLDQTNDVTFVLDAKADVDAGGSGQCPQGSLTQLVFLPQPGVPADPGALCAVTPPAASNTAARVIFTSFDKTTNTARGFVAVPPNVLPSIVGLPTITVTTASDPKFAQLQVANVTTSPGGFMFDASWPTLNLSAFGGSMTVKTTLTVACEAGTEVVESITPVELCITDGLNFEWVSAGDACTVCTIIAEMAPSPIVSDVMHDGLPLARVIRIVVRELARAGRSVLLMAENDAGEDADYEWRVSKGTIRHVAPDVVLWTLPDGIDRPFGQVAVWNDDGAVVENFVWGRA